MRNFYFRFFLSFFLLSIVSCKSIQHTYIRPEIAERVVVKDDQVSSHNGYQLFPQGNYRALNIFINIIYDETPERDPLLNDKTQLWPSSSRKGINEAVPTYLSNFMDAKYESYEKLRGTMTKLYFESSFGALLILGDFIVVNILQSDITESSIGQSFDYRRLINKAVEMINDKGFTALNGYESVSDYDQDGDKKFDYTQILVRNSVNKGQSYNYGSKDIGDGITGTFLPETIELKDGSLTIGAFSYQGVGTKDIAEYLTGIVIHELSHNLLGDNGFHTSGGNHFGTPNLYASTFMGLQSGYGLMGGGSLVSCNGFERWRLGWTNHHYNPNKIPISALNSNFEIVPTDLKQDKSKHTIYLRDFVSYGDAVRINLPYKDGPNASNQYLWLENHQVGRNGKLDYLEFSKITPDCRPQGRPGVYAYIQVGKDILVGDRNQVFSKNETDNLYIVSAEGNWDVEFIGKQWDCSSWGERSVIKYIEENPLSGAHDQSPVFTKDGIDVINTKTHGHKVNIKEKGGIIYDVGSNMGDDFDPFISGTELSLSTNPTPSNVRTYYVNQFGGNVMPAYPERNTEHIYLTGLNIKFSEMADKVYGRIMKVDISWDNYTVSKDVRWTGNIIVPEELIVSPNTTIDLDQNRTAQIESRDLYSGEFAEHTMLTIASGSEMTLEEKSQLNLLNKSTLVIKENAVLTIQSGAKVVVDADCVIQIESGARLLVEDGGQLIVNDGGYFSSSPEALIDCDNCSTKFTISSMALMAVPEGSKLQNIKCVKNVGELF